MRRGLLALVFLTTIGIATPNVADAQPAQPTPLSSAEAQQAEARTEMRDGIANQEAKDYEGALRHFRRATELVPEANLPHRHSARALEGLGRWDEAVVEYQEYLRIKSDVSDAPAVKNQIEEIRRLHLTGTVSLSQCKPLPTDVSVDGQPALLTSIGDQRELRVLKGPHRLIVRAPDHTPREIEINVDPNATTSPECTMDRVSVIPALSGSSSSSSGSSPLQPVPPSGEKPSPWYGRWYTWAGAGVLVAGGVIATILIAGAKHSTPPATEGGNHAFP